MRILYISTPNFADCDFPLVKAFQEKGIDITYLIQLPPWYLKTSLINIQKQLPQTKILPATAYSELQYLESYMDMNKVYVANRTGQSRLTFSYWKNLCNIHSFIKKGKYDVIHYPGFDNRWFYKIAPLFTVIHDPFPHAGEGYKSQRRARELAIKRSKGIVLLNNNQVDDFCKAYSINREKVLVNSLGVYDNIHSFVNSEIVPQRHNLLFFGRISPYKGIEYLCEAMKLVHEQIPDATLTIAGKGNFYFDIKQYKKFDYYNIVNRYISMAELAYLLSVCELCVCPYTDATQSGVIMTSFALCKPVIATRVGGLGDMIENGKSGVLVPPRDVDSLADAIINLLKDEEKRKDMSEFIKNEYIKGKQSWSAIADRYLKYYSEMLSTE